MVDFMIMNFLLFMDLQMEMFFDIRNWICLYLKFIFEILNILFNFWDIIEYNENIFVM